MNQYVQLKSEKYYQDACVAEHRKIRRQSLKQMIKPFFAVIACWTVLIGLCYVYSSEVLVSGNAPGILQQTEQTQTR